MGEHEEINFEEMTRYLRFAWEAHWCYTKPGHDQFRRHDGATPFFVHPAWAAMTFMQEAALTLETRWLGWRALILHDVREDTNLRLPSWVPKSVRELVEQLSFGSTEEGMKQIWDRPPLVRLLAAYDKASNLLDAAWMKERPLEYQQQYEEYALALADDAERNYGELNISRIIRSLCRVAR